MVSCENEKHAGLLWVLKDHWRRECIGDVAGPNCSRKDICLRFRCSVKADKTEIEESSELWCHKDLIRCTAKYTSCLRVWTNTQLSQKMGSVTHASASSLDVQRISILRANAQHHQQ